MADKQRLLGLQMKFKCPKSTYILLQRSKLLSSFSKGLIQLIMKLPGFVPLTWSWPWQSPQPYQNSLPEQLENILDDSGKSFPQTSHIRSPSILLCFFINHSVPGKLKIQLIKCKPQLSVWQDTLSLGTGIKIIQTRIMGQWKTIRWINFHFY